MIPGYPSQFSNGSPNNAQQAIPNPLIKSPIQPAIQKNSSSQFQINLDVQMPQPINMIVQQQNNPVQQQAKSFKQNQPKQLTIQQSIQQPIQNSVKMPQALQSQQHQIQNVMIQHPVPQQMQHQSLQQPIQNSMMHNSIQLPVQQPMQQSPLQHQSVQLHQIPIPQKQMIRPIITSPNCIQLPQEHIQAQMSNHQTQSAINMPRVDNQVLHPILNSPPNQNIIPEINHNLNRDSNTHVHNILQQFVPQISSDQSLVFDDEFQVEGIADEREIKGKRQYLVQWAGFSDDENTWEDESNLSRYYQLINDFRMNGPKPRNQRRIVEFISGFISNGKVHYNVLYQNDEVGTLTGLQARGSRVKQQLINFLEREFSFPEKDRIVIPPKPPKQPKSPLNSTDGQKQTTSSANAMSEYEYEYVEEEEEIENPDNSTVNGEVLKIKKRIKKKRKVVQVSTDEPGSVADIETKEDSSVEEIKIQKKILQDDPIEVLDTDDM